MAIDWEKKFSRYLTGEVNGREHRGYCPVHEDPETSKTPSASFNFFKETFNCFSQCGGLSLSQVWQIIREEEEPRGNVRSIDSARSRRGQRQPSSDLPSDVDIKGWTERLLKNRAALAPLLNSRGLTEETIEQFEVGWNGERYTIPVRAPDGRLLNVRRYLLGATSNKMMNWPGFGQAELFLSDALRGEWVVVCEGEMDALLARQHGFPALSSTAGAGTWADRWSPLFGGKKVYLVYDVDPQGEQGAKKVAMRLSKAGAIVHIVRLPLQMKGGDITNYFVDQGFSASDFQQLLDETPVYQSRLVSKEGRREKPARVSLEESFSSDLAEKPVEVVATISGKVQPPYMMPKRTSLNCDQSWSKAKCSHCPMDMYHNGQHELEVPADSRLLLRLVDATEAQRRQYVLKEVGVPHTCPVVELTDLEQWSVEHLILVPSVDDPSVTNANVDRVAYNVGRHNTPINTTVKMVGINTGDPRNQRMTLQTWECERTTTSLDNFKLTPELQEALTVFHPAEGQLPIDKLCNIAEDLSANVTKIYGREMLHVAYDLVWHSVLDFKFRGTLLGKGWLEMLVIGDTRTGKSEAALRLSRHYEAGVLTSCEGATLAGLVGGAQQVGNSWVITWGTIPLQDRRLVVLDEVSGLKDRNILENMSEVRSSGRAKVTKIVSQQTFARTRLVWISNPADGRRIDELPRGAIDAINDLVRNPEDIARFDMAMVAASSDVESKLINAARPPKVEHVYTRELCSALVMWAWSRRPDQVVWEKGAERLALRLAEEMGGRYVADPPLIQSENVRVKLARISVAVAARLFSHDGTGERVLVCKEHVRTARRVLDRLYRQPTFGYASHSRKEIRAREEAERNRKECRRYLVTHEHVTTALSTVVSDTQFRVRDLEEFGGLVRDEAQIAVMELVRLRMVRRHTKGYIRMTPELISLIRSLEDK